MFLDDLNDKQFEAVRATEGHVRVIAGAGSGKTRVLAFWVREGPEFFPSRAY